MKPRILVLMLLAGILLNGCRSGRRAPEYDSTWDQTLEKDVLTRMPGASLEPQQQQEPQPELEQRKDLNVASQTYPCGSLGVMRLDRWIPAELQRSAPFMYAIKVTNQTTGVVDDVVVRDQMGEDFKAIGSNPQAQADGRTLTWMLGSIQAGASKEITITGVATADGPVQQCATMTYAIPTVPACVSANVVNTEISVAKVMAEEALLCDTIPMRIGVKNTGSGIAHNVIIRDSLPSGMTSANGETELRFDVGSLQPGQSKEYPVDLKAARTGIFENTAKATCANGIWVESGPARVTVRQPSLEIAKIGPAKRFLGRPIPYQITVTNRGTASAQDLVITDTAPAGMSFVNADNRGTLRDNRVVWNLPALAPNQSQVVNVTYKANRHGTFVNEAVAQASCAEPVRASARTTVQGMSAVLLEVIDLDDPVEVGSIETYLIATTNQGSSDGTNVHIVCTLENNMEYASSDGPTEATVQGNIVSFAPLPRLAPKAKATWKLVVKALEPGDVRFRVSLISDQLSRPVEETEVNSNL